MIRGKFQALDDFDLAGHRLLNWNWLADLPRAGATAGQALLWDGSKWAPGDVDTGGGSVGDVEWDDILNKPSVFTPDDHTHVEADITDLQSYALASHTHVPGDITGLDTGVTTLTAGAGINLSSSTDAVTITNSGVLSIVAGTNISVSTSTGTVTISSSAGGGSSDFVKAVKASDTVRTSTTTFADDPDLTLSVEADSIYRVYIILLYSASTLPDLKYQFVTSSGNGTLRVDDTFVYNMNLYGLSSPQSVPCSGVDNIIGSSIHGVLFTAGAADTFKVQWAQNASSANASKLHAGSFVLLQKLG